ncbi:MAG: LutB/LldF family L-lactate oxidation iron-sulfur protein [Pirellulaceae bacterium]
MSTTDYLREQHHEFLEASAEALENPRLQAILTRLGDTLGQENPEVWASFPGSDAVRERARAIKDATLANLHEHLKTLDTSVRRRGGHVHWAATGEEACQTIVDLLKQRGLHRVVKSKSMTTEEIHLNTALAEAGIDVTETDLGEYIVQVAGHRPSHIVGPALHMSKEEVAETLAEEAGHPLPSVPEELTMFARRQLRSRFAAAEAGITGANFAIAETGSIVLVENEGNARFTTGLPKIHIALMGMEKVIPRLADLPVFLKVLARAATGQRMSIYTSIITGPRQPDELDGPEEFHLVVLDNGRSRILGGPLRESLFCIRCGACLNACPVYCSIGGHSYGGVYAGPIGAVLTPLFDGLVANHHLPHASSLCGACQAACPVKIQIPELLLQLRHELHKEPNSPSRWEGVAYRAWARVLKRPLLYQWATWMATRTVGRWFRKTGWLRRLPGKLHGWTQSRDFPAPAPQRFRDAWQRDAWQRQPADNDLEAPGNET